MCVTPCARARAITSSSIACWTSKTSSVPSGASDEATGIAWIPMPGPISRMDHRCEDRGCAANARANGSPSAQPGSNARDEAWEPNLMLQYRVTKAATLATKNHPTTHGKRREMILAHSVGDPVPEVDLGAVQVEADAAAAR